MAYKVKISNTFIKEGGKSREIKLASDSVSIGDVIVSVSGVFKKIEEVVYGDSYDGITGVVCKDDNDARNKPVLISLIDDTMACAVEIVDSTGQVVVSATLQGNELQKIISDVIGDIIDDKYCMATFKNYDGTVLQRAVTVKGTAPVYTGDTPTKPATLTNKYTFTGWSPAVGPITEDTEYTAQFEESLVLYRVLIDTDQHYPESYQRDGAEYETQIALDSISFEAEEGCPFQYGYDSDTGKYYVDITYRSEVTWNSATHSIVFSEYEGNTDPKTLVATVNLKEDTEEMFYWGSTPFIIENDVPISADWNGYEVVELYCRVQHAQGKLFFESKWTESISEGSRQGTPRESKYPMHVPSYQEFQRVFNMVASYGNGCSLLHFPDSNGFQPRGKYIDVEGVEVQNVTGVDYWTCDREAGSYEDPRGIVAHLFSSSITKSYASTRLGLAIRGFCDVSVTPCNPDGTAKPGWVKEFDSSQQCYETESKVQIWHNVSDGILSVTDDKVNWITICDKNVGATEVYDGTNDTLSDLVFQWGNIYPHVLGANNRTTTTVQAQVSGDYTDSGWGVESYYIYSAQADNNQYSWDEFYNTTLFGMSGFTQGQIEDHVQWDAGSYC